MNRGILLDTHTALWLSRSVPDYARLTQSHVDQIDRAARSNSVYLSAISVWEISFRQQRGGFPGLGDITYWLARHAEPGGMQLLPITAEIAIESTRLPLWLRPDKKEHRDPADRFLVATARIHQLTLLTADELILHYAALGHLRAEDIRK